MSTLPVLPPQTVVIPGKNPVDDDVTLVINGRKYGGWLDVRISRGIERCPNDFELKLTDFFPGDPNQLQIKPGDPCIVMIGTTPVVTGYVDMVMPQIATGMHVITVFGRGKCQDLVDCSAEWPTGQIQGASVLAIAQKLAQPYGITVDTLDDAGPAIPQFNLMRGESAWEIIERLCRVAQLLAYEDIDGNLLIGRVSTQKVASGFTQGVNVISAVAVLTQHQRFQTYQCYPVTIDQARELGKSDLISESSDPGVLRHRLKIVIPEVNGDTGFAVSKQRADWERSRRFGRSFSVKLTTDAWRDAAGVLYEPNTLAAIDIPAIKVDGQRWTISEVTYRKNGEQGTQCDLTLMPPQAFIPQPTVFQPLPAELNSLPASLVTPR